MSEVCMAELEKEEIRRMKKEAKKKSKIQAKDKILKEILFLQFRIKAIKRNLLKYH